MSQRIVVIDDSPDIHALLDVRLRPEGHALHFASTPADGIALVRRLLPDLVLLDVDMPGMSGFDLCSELKADPLTMEIPVIFLTGAGDVASKVLGFDLGGVDYVTKPFEPAELRARVRAALRTKRYHDLLAVRARVDGLTTLWNRSYFDQRLKEELDAANRYGRAVGLVLIDIDHFKQLNDGCGHPFGDLVLTRIGERLWECLRAADAPCRFGGEELACVLTETSLEGALAAAERIRASLGAMGLSHRGAPVPVTASFGAASTTLKPGQKWTATDLVAAADEALYQAKRTGRDRVCAATAQVTEAG